MAHDDHNDTHKHLLRARLRKRRRDTSDADRLVASRAVATRLAPFVEGVDTVACFAAHDHEIDLAALFAVWREEGKRLAFPRVVGKGEMVFAEVETLADLRPGAHGILEPTGPPLGMDSIDKFLVPAVAYDRRGHRLGFGGGYYDRALRSVEKPAEFLPFFIGVGYSWQLLSEDLPSDPWDVDVHCVVTDQEVWHVGGDSRREGDQA